MVAGDQYFIQLFALDRFFQTCLIKGFPSILARTLAGKRLEAKRAGMTPMVLISSLRRPVSIHPVQWPLPPSCR